MKYFNLETLQKKTPYKTPEDFFGKMQEHVLKETIKSTPKPTPVVKLHFSAVTSLAAALALLLGISFFWKTNQAEMTKPTPAKEAPVYMDNAPELSTKEPLKKEEKEVLAPSQSLSTKELGAPHQKETDEELLLNTLTEDEIIEWSKNDEQDIYLELYN